jgi:hypothetical protein
MKTAFSKMLAILLVAATLLGILSGCNTAEPEASKPGSSVGSTENPTTDGTEPTTGTTETPTEADPTTGTTAGDPADHNIISGTENTEPTTEPTTQPSTNPTEPSDETEACAHKWSTWKTVDPTCTKDGSKSRNCANCGKTEKETLKATGHKYGSWSTTKAATCSAAGSKERKCPTCGNVQNESIATLSHSYGAWSTTKQATCGAKGEKVRTCSSCGNQQTESIAALAHKFGSWTTTKAATCDTNGTKSRTCSGCNKTETQSIAATGHVWDGGKVTTTPTSCSAMGIKTYTCTKCGKTKTEQITGNHTFGEWKYEEYTYKQDGVDRPSHRKVRACTKCGYKEYGNTPDHSCKQGSKNHTITTVKEGTCTTKAIMRSTCKICGWYVEYEGRKSDHNNKTETRHLTDYGTYTNELDAKVTTCTVCGQQSVNYIKGEGWSDYNRYAVNISIAGGADQFSLEYPEYQMVKRNFVYDSNGYVKQFTIYWWHNGSRYSQVIKCDKASMIAWFAEYGMSATGTETFQIKAYGSQVKPYKISWTG